MPNKEKLSNGVELGVWGNPSSNSLPSISFPSIEKLIKILTKDKSSIEFFSQIKKSKREQVPIHILFEINDKTHK